MRDHAASAFRADLARWIGSDRPVPAIEATLRVIANPGLQAVLLMRLQMRFQDTRQRRLAQIISVLNLRLTGAEFVPGCAIGPGFVMRHPQGIVIGGGSQVGTDCTFLHRVTLGERYGDGSDPEHDYPKVGSRVVIGAGAVVLGAVTIGDDAMIGANAVVLDNVPAGNVAVGIPAKASPRR